jgi:hypothetical protein
MTRYIFDSAALIQLERGNRMITGLLQRILDSEDEGVIPRTVLAEVWRGGPRQARLARALNRAERLRHGSLVIDELSPGRAMEIGEKIGRCGHDDIVDVNVVLCALPTGSQRTDALVLTADREDLLRVDERLKPIIVDI